MGARTVRFGVTRMEFVTRCGSESMVVAFSVYHGMAFRFHACVCSDRGWEPRSMEMFRRYAGG